MKAAMIQAIGFTLGMGSGNDISRSLGNRDQEAAVRAGDTETRPSQPCLL